MPKHAPKPLIPLSERLPMKCIAIVAAVFLLSGCAGFDFSMCGSFGYNMQAETVCAAKHPAKP